MPEQARVHEPYARPTQNAVRVKQGRKSFLMNPRPVIRWYHLPAATPRRVRDLHLRGRLIKPYPPCVCTRAARLGVSASNVLLCLSLVEFIRLFGIFTSHQTTQELDSSDVQPRVPNGLH